MSEHTHTFERFELKAVPAWWSVRPERLQRPWYVGYRCECGESGYAVGGR